MTAKGAKMKTNKYLKFVVNALGTIEDHDFMVSKIALSPDVREHVKNEADNNHLFGASIVETNGIGHIKVYSNKGHMNELFMDEKFDPKTYHEPSNPQCSICKILHRDVIGMDQLEARMYPKKYSDEGFLKTGEKLQDIIDKDEKTLKDLGITYNQIADRLTYVTKRAKHIAWLWAQDNTESDYFKHVDKGIIVDNLKIKWVSYCGYQECPYDCEGQESLSDTDFTITDVKTSTSIFCSELHPHLIRKHHFFEGHTKYRLDPKTAIEVLGIQPGIQYPIKLGTQYFWNLSSSSSGGEESIEDFKKEVKKNSYHKEYVEVMGGTTLDLGKDIEAYLKDDQLVIFAEKNVDKTLNQEINGVLFKERIRGISRSLYKKISSKYVMKSA
jgi:hypothetical protein